MSEEQHEQQSRDIRNIELKLERMEERALAGVAVQAAAKEDMKSLFSTVGNIERKIDDLVARLPENFVTIREFNSYKDSVAELLKERKDGNKSWQSWVMTFMPYIMSAILGLYVIFGGR